MTNVLQRALSIVEVLAAHPEGLSVSEVAGRINIPPSAAHRLLNEMIGYGYVRQTRHHGDYALTIKLAIMGRMFLEQSGIFDITQLALDDLAEQSQELARMSVVDGDDLVWVARAQGATTGLRYDPGRDNTAVHLAGSATGQAWLMTMSDEDALMRVARQGFAPTDHEAGPNAPATSAELFALLKAARSRGFSIAINSFAWGMAAMAAPVRHGNTDSVIGVVSIAGPSARLTEERLTSLGDKLLLAASRIGAASEKMPHAFLPE